MRKPDCARCCKSSLVCRQADELDQAETSLGVQLVLGIRQDAT